MSSFILLLSRLCLGWRSYITLGWGTVGGKDLRALDLLHKGVAHLMPGGAAGSTWFFEHQPGTLAAFAEVCGPCVRLHLEVPPIYGLLILALLLLRRFHFTKAGKNIKVLSTSFPCCRTRKTKRPSLIKAFYTPQAASSSCSGCTGLRVSARCLPTEFQQK